MGENREGVSSIKKWQVPLLPVGSLPLMCSFPLEAEDSALRKVSLHLVTEENG